MKTSLADLAAYQQAARTQRNASDQLKAGGVEAAAKAFEAMFIKMLLDAMPESEDSAISGGFGGGGAVGHQWRAALEQIGPPRFTAFIEDGVRQDIIEEALLGNLFGPPKGGSSLHREIKIFDEQFGGQFLVVAWRMFL